MARLTWDSIDSRLFETGVDRGVLYVEDLPGVSWSGLISVEENSSGGEPKAYYQDGEIYLTVFSKEKLNVTIEAYTYPDEFMPCDGTQVSFGGIHITQQRRKSFGLSYRTSVGGGLSGLEKGYKIHLVYGCLANPSRRFYQSLRQEVEPSIFSWSCTTTPKHVGNGMAPSAHVIIDSRKISANDLRMLEDILYGTIESLPRLPSPEELIDLFSTSPGDVFIVQFNPDTGLSTLIPALEGDVFAEPEAGEFSVSLTSRLTGGAEDGTYEWEG